MIDKYLFGVDIINDFIQVSLILEKDWINGKKHYPYIIEQDITHNIMKYFGFEMLSDKGIHTGIFVSYENKNKNEIIKLLNHCPVLKYDSFVDDYLLDYSYGFLEDNKKELIICVAQTIFWETNRMIKDSYKSKNIIDFLETLGFKLHGNSAFILPIQNESHANNVKLLLNSNKYLKFDKNVQRHICV